MSRSFRYVVLLACALFVTAIAGRGEGRAPLETASLESEIDAVTRAHDVPGLAVEIVGAAGASHTFQRGFEDVATKAPVTRATPFALGAVEAFTAVGAYLLEADGKLSLAAPVSAYLPWFTARFGGRGEAISVAQLLRHTSGVPRAGVARIPLGVTSLEAAVRSVSGVELEARPGQRALRAEANHLVLCLVLEAASGQTYAHFLKERVLDPLGLRQTSVGEGHRAAQGHKLSFGRWRRADDVNVGADLGPIRIVTTPADAARWLELGLGLVEPPPPLAAAMAKSHEPDQSVLPDAGGAFQAAGWSVLATAGGVETSAGASPGFSSSVGLLPGENVGVVVLANANSAAVEALAANLTRRLAGRGWPARPGQADTATQVDRVASLLAALATSAVLALLVATFAALRDVFARRRSLVAPNLERLASVAVATGFLALLGLSLRELPRLLYDGLPFEMALAWAPFTLRYALALAGAAGASVFLYFVVSLVTSEGRGVYAWLAVFSAVSGVGNALVIVVINETFVRQGNLTNGLLPAFVLGLLLYVAGQRFLRRRVVRLTNDMLLSERRQLIGALHGATFPSFEGINRGEIVTAAGSDVDVLAGSVGQIVTGLTHAITMLCCFAYLLFLSPPGFLVALAVIALSVWAHTIVGNRAEVTWETARDAQGRFFDLLNQLLDGFKELKLDGRKRAAFREEIDASCRAYSAARVEGDLRFADAFAMGELLFTSVIGAVAFVYPSIFPGIEREVVRTFVIVFLYMLSPLDWILQSYPQVLRIRIGWRRIRKLAAELGADAAASAREAAAEAPRGEVRLEAHDVTFEHTDGRGRSFRLGPIRCSFAPGQVTFITGGNGSGKSTFAKLVTGLYPPGGGELRVNGKVATPETLSECFSAIFSDFHLFDRLYGVDVTGKEEEIAARLRELELEEKVRIEGGKFSTTRLSTGQRRRLALLVSYLEDKPVCLYDEWAAEQDPHFRAYFYQTILPDLRARGKCVIVITHDDRYFPTADQLLKFELGKIVDVA